MGYGSEDEDLSQEITLGLVFFIIIIYQKFHHIEMFFYGIKMSFLMKVYRILDFFNRPNVKLILILIVVVVFFLTLWKVLLWIEEKLNQYEEKSRTKKKSLRNLKKSNPIFPGIHKRPGMFQRIFKNIGKTDESFFQSERFEENDDGEEEKKEEDVNIAEDIPSQKAPEVFDEDSEMSPDIQYPSDQEIPEVIEKKTKEVMKNQKNQTKKKVKKSLFFEDTDILGLK